MKQKESNQTRKTIFSKYLIVIKIVVIIFLLNLIMLLNSKVFAASDQLLYYGKDNFREEYSNGYIRNCTSSDVIRTSSGVSIKNGNQINPNTWYGFKSMTYYSGNNTSKSEYIDFSKAARTIDNNGNPIWLDMRVYIWTNNSNYRWALHTGEFVIYNLLNKVTQYTTMEFHFYTVGHCGESNYEQSFKGITRMADMDAREGFYFYSGYNQFYVPQGNIPGIYVAKGSKNSTNANNPFGRSGIAEHSYFFGTQDNDVLVNVWVEVNSISSTPLKFAYGIQNDPRGGYLYYTGTPIEYYINGTLKDTYYCVPYGRYRLVDTSKIAGQVNNYTVDGWYTSTSYTTKASNGIAGTSTIKLYGRTFSNYTVKYNGNGATSGSTANSSHVYNTSKNLTSNGFQRKYTVTFNGNYEGAKEEKKTATYKFKNWDTKANGTGTKYNNSQSVINLTSTAGGVVNMYAIWEPASVNYVPEREGYSFQGWYLDAECTAKVSDNEYTPTKDTTLYAKWEKDYTITVDNSKDGHTYNSYQIFQGDYYEKETKVKDANGVEKIVKIPILSNIEWAKELQKEVEQGKTHGDKIIELLKENEKDKSESYKLYTDCKTAEDIAEVLKVMPNDGDDY